MSSGGGNDLEKAYLPVQILELHVPSCICCGVVGCILTDRSLVDLDIKVYRDCCCCDYREFQTDTWNKLSRGIVLHYLVEVLKHCLVDNKYSAISLQSIVPEFIIDA